MFMKPWSKIEMEEIERPDSYHSMPPLGHIEFISWFKKMIAVPAQLA